MDWKTPGHDGDQVESLIQGCQIGMQGNVHGGRIDDPPALPGGDRRAPLVDRRPRLHFDECDQPTTPDDEIDFADTDTKPLIEDSIAL